MSDKKLIYAGDARRAILEADPKLAYCIERIKAVDAVEVVRCKDCKWYKEGELLAPNKFCFRLKHPTEDRNVGYNFGDEDFCYYGERKDNDST